jgi:hypothetical protein
VDSPAFTAQIWETLLTVSQCQRKVPAADKECDLYMETEEAPLISQRCLEHCGVTEVVVTQNH